MLILRKPYNMEEEMTVATINELASSTTEHLEYILSGGLNA